MKKKNGNTKSMLNVPISVISKLIVLMFILVAPSYALTNENIKWSDDGNTYRLTQTDNTFTDRYYTIKVVEFPFAVRGYKTLDGSVYTERPVTPFVKFELYKDIMNNPKPIDTFTIGIGEEYITSDQEMRITINDIPGSTSQDWVYEYYNPWVIIKTQARSIPNLDIAINLIQASGDDIEDDNIRSGETIDAEIRMKNVGNDVLEDMNFDIDYGQLTLDDVGETIKLKDSVSQLVKDEEKIVKFRFMVPVSLEQKVYEIHVNVSGHDVKDIMYNFSASRIINTKSDVEAMYVEKLVSRNTSYLTEYVGVALNIVNTGHVAIDDVRIHDAIPDRLIIKKDGAIQNYTEFSLNKSSIGPSESWTIEYSLKPKEPGIYILPQFDVNFSVGERNISATSSEVGFRVFGPQVVLVKSATDMGNGVAKVTVSAKNIGNGPTRVVIKDKLPNRTVLISGSENTTMSLNPDSEKIMDYTIQAEDTNISNIIWSPAIATYYLDDWRFSTSSDDEYQAGHKVEEGYQLRGGTGAHVVVSTSVASAANAVYPEVTLPKMEEEQKKVVATIPVKTPEKSTPGFVLYDLIPPLTVLILLKRKNAKK